MKISEMDKPTLLNELKTTRELHYFNSESKLWKRAFELYKAERGETLDMGCGKCFDKVKKFMES